VLDLGCGTGADAIFLAGQNYDVHGLDFSAEALRLARQRAGERNVVLARHGSSALKTPFDDGYFNLTDRGCCHYMAGSIRQQYAEEVARILRPCGTLFLRGCRNPEDTSFATIDRNSLVECFDPRLFEIATVIPI
jgi:SAM-dependent methyltransferase